MWSMGITQHRDGVANVRAIVDLALARGFVGREKCGLMPIRGHSGVQGGAEVGAVPNQFPGGVAVDVEGAKQFAELWGFDVPASRGMNAVEMIDAAHQAVSFDDACAINNRSDFKRAVKAMLAASAVKRNDQNR